MKIGKKKFQQEFVFFFVLEISLFSDIYSSLLIPFPGLWQHFKLFEVPTLRSLFFLWKTVEQHKSVIRKIKYSILERVANTGQILLFAEFLLIDHLAFKDEQ